MTRYLLDTTVLIDFAKGREPARARVRAMLAGGGDLGVCAINVAEFYSGLAPGSQPRLDEFINSLSYWNISREAAAVAGGYRHEFARKGRQLSTTDTLIAAVAREHRAVVVTSNVKDYPMSDVEALAVRGQ